MVRCLFLEQRQIGGCIYKIISFIGIMTIAIHHRPGSFSDRWIEYCKKNGIDYKIVNVYDSDIVEQVKGCDAFMWHHHHGDYRDVLFAKQLIYSLEEAGVKCFPDFHTTWHFDDKVGQKYLLEATGAPLVPSYVFYTKEEAYAWINQTTFPKVFKLRGGAGASNVKLAHNASEAKKFVDKAFGKGFPAFDRKGNLKEHYNKWRHGKEPFKSVVKGVGRLFIPTAFGKMHSPEKGYVYFQDFIPNNYYDIRVIVIDDKAFYIKRMVREGDFRASGSGDIIYEKDVFTEKCIKLAFETNKKLKSQSTSFDFVMQGDKPLIVEISYGFAVKAYDNCEGYYDSEMTYHPGPFNPQEWMVDEVRQAALIAGGGI